MIFLGDNFPQSLKNQGIELNLKPGCVIKIEFEFEHTTKNKFIVIGATDDGYLLGFFINSVVNKFIENNQLLNKCQVKIDAKNHSFLQYDSYIACHEIKEIHKEDVIREINRDLNKIKGEISIEIKDQVIAAIKFAQTISEVQKRILIEALT